MMTRPGFESFVRAELARRRARGGTPADGRRERTQRTRDPGRAVASVAERRLTDTGREASAAASIPLAAALRPTRGSTNRAAVSRRRGGSRAA